MRPPNDTPTSVTGSRPSARATSSRRARSPSSESASGGVPGSPHSENVATRNRVASAASVGAIHSQRPWIPGTSTSGGPDPWISITSVPQRLAGVERVLDARQRLRLGAQREERLALEVEEVLFADERGAGERSAGEDVRQLPADERVVIADPAGAVREMDAELEERFERRAADRNRGAEGGRLVAFGDARERERLGVREQTIAVHGDPIDWAQEPHRTRLRGRRGRPGEAD